MIMQLQAGRLSGTEQRQWPEEEIKGTERQTIKKSETGNGRERQAAKGIEKQLERHVTDWYKHPTQNEHWSFAWEYQVWRVISAAW